MARKCGRAATGSRAGSWISPSSPPCRSRPQSARHAHDNRRAGRQSPSFHHPGAGGPRQPHARLPTARDARGLHVPSSLGVLAATGRPATALIAWLPRPSHAFPHRVFPIRWIAFSSGSAHPSCRVHACCFPLLSVDGRRASGPTPGAGIARPTPSLVVRAKNVACNHPSPTPALSDREFRERDSPVMLHRRQRKVTYDRISFARDVPLARHVTQPTFSCP